MGKNFRFRDFRFKIRLKLFWIDSDQKIFFDQNFLPLSFFRYFGHFGRKTTKSHEKKFTREKIFDFEIFVLKYVSKHSESIPKKKFFDQKFSKIFIFWSYFIINRGFWTFLGQKSFFQKKFHYRFKNFIDQIQRYHWLMYLYPLRRAHQMSWLHHLLRLIHHHL